MCVRYLDIGSRSFRKSNQFLNQFYSIDSTYSLTFWKLFIHVKSVWIEEEKIDSHIWWWWAFHKMSSYMGYVVKKWVSISAHQWIFLNNGLFQPLGEYIIFFLFLIRIFEWRVLVLRLAYEESKFEGYLPMYMSIHEIIWIMKSVY